MTISTETQNLECTTNRGRPRVRRGVVAAIAGLTAIALTAGACGFRSFRSSPDTETAARMRNIVAVGNVDNTDGAKRALPVSTSDGSKHTDLHRPGQYTAGRGTGQWSNMNDFMTYVIQDVDSYWTPVMTSSGQPEPSTQYQFTLPGQVVDTPCGQTSDTTAMYCPSDNTIYFSQQWAVNLWNGAWVGPDGQRNPGPGGDLSVALLLAHEYAHSMQQKLGLLSRYTTPQTEQHADCWAGVWMRQAAAQGILDPGDVQEAVNVDFLVGDSNFAAAGHHGTPSQRVRAFTIGYDSGTPTSCDAVLNSGPEGLA